MIAGADLGFQRAGGTFGSEGTFFQVQGCIFFYIRPPCWGGKFFKNFELGKVFKIHVRGKEGGKGKKWGKGKKRRREKEGKFPSPL